MQNNPEKWSQEPKCREEGGRREGAWEQRGHRRCWHTTLTITEASGFLPQHSPGPCLILTHLSLSPVVRTLPHDIIYSRLPPEKLPPPSTMTLGIKASTDAFERHTFSPQHFPSPGLCGDSTNFPVCTQKTSTPSFPLHFSGFSPRMGMVMGDSKQFLGNQ